MDLGSVLVTLISALVISEAAKLPPYIKPCSLSDPEFNKCAKEHGQQAIPKFANGDKKYKVPSLSPLVIPLITVIPGNNLKVELINVEVRGFENTILNDISWDFDKKHIKFNSLLPVLNLVCEYNMKGQIVILPIEGHGPANITYTGVTFVYDFYYDLNEKNGKKYFVAKGGDLEYNVTDAHYKLDNLFNGDKRLGDEMNKFLNENQNDVQKELGGTVTQAIIQIISTLLNTIFELVPFEEAFLP
ncbi:uncharacterized protein CBL_12073 [Carabus blaptoides fortunei]